jgi:hypothetical protein
MLDRFTSWLTAYEESAPLVVFRWVIGGLIFLEAAGSLALGWVKTNLVEPEVPLPFMGFEFLSVLQGPAMYGVFAVMAWCGLCIAFGYRYRLHALLFGLLWSICYLMQKASYNNHYYLLMLLGWYLPLIDPHTWASIDVKRKPELKQLGVPRWQQLFFVVMVFIVFFYASKNKLYAGWLNNAFISGAFSARSHFPIIGPLLAEEWFQWLITSGGVFFDLLVIPALLWRKTRWFAFAGMLFFNLFNSAVFHIGIFPYMVIGLCVFFFDKEAVRKLFLRSKPSFERIEALPEVPEQKQRWVAIAFVSFFVVQALLPLRHHLIPGDVNWTEEGHRLSWRMMLRSKSGQVRFDVVDKATGLHYTEIPNLRLSRKQTRSVAGKPDMMWQYAQYLKNWYKEEKGLDVQVFAKSEVRLNGGPAMPLVADTVDLAAQKWRFWGDNPWITDVPEENTVLTGIDLLN